MKRLLVSNRTRVVCVAAMLSVVSIATTVRAQEPRDLDVTSLTKEGIAAAQAGRWDEARQKFQTAWVKSNSYAVAANLAYVEEHFENFPRAAELFAFAIRTYPAGEPPEKKTEDQQKGERDIGPGILPTAPGQPPPIK